MGSKILSKIKSVTQIIGLKHDSFPTYRERWLANKNFCHGGHWRDGLQPAVLPCHFHDVSDMCGDEGGIICQDHSSSFKSVCHQSVDFGRRKMRGGQTFP